MILSMTGFGRGVSSSPTKKITVEIKSLNSKQFDISMRVPSLFRELEVETRNRLASRLERGKADMAVMVENLAVETTSSVNIPLLAAYKKQIEEMRESLGLPEPSDWYQVLLRMPDAMKTESHHLEQEDIDAFEKACNEAVEHLQEFRAEEGKKTSSFL